MAQIPLVPTKIVHTRASYGDEYVTNLTQQNEHSIEDLNVTITNVSRFILSLVAYE